MIGIELRHLRYFIAVAEERNFTRAAGRVHVSQPPLSAQIRQLEQRLGAPLFVRSSGPVALTAAGEALLEPAYAALAALDAGVEAVRAVTSATAASASPSRPPCRSPPRCAPSPRSSGGHRAPART